MARRWYDNPRYSKYAGDRERAAARVPIEKKKAQHHCQICERAIHDNTGTIALHGYKRPGHGWQTPSCMGAKHQAYEFACDALPPAIKAITEYIEQQEAALAKWIASPPDTISINVSRGSWSKPVFEDRTRPDDFDASERPASWTPRSYEGAYWSHRNGLAQDIKFARQDLVRLEKRLANWKAPKEK